jgi:hypothetical protein
LGTVVIKLVEPTLPGGYAINVLNPAPRPWNATTNLNMTVKVQGTVPSSPTYGVTLTCWIQIWSWNGLWQVMDFTNAMPYSNGSGEITASFKFESPMVAEWAGTATWTMKCHNGNVSGDDWKQDTGTIEITAGS